MSMLPILSLGVLIACVDEAEMAPRLDVAEANEAAQLELAKRVREVDAAMREVQEARSTGSPSPDASPVREVDGVPLVPATRLDAPNAPYTFVVTRNGSAAPVPGTTSPVRDETPCGWYLERPVLRYGSDLLLNRSKLGRASPYLLLENGVPLRPHAANDEHAARCAGAYRHAGARFEFSPTGYAEAASERSYTIAYDERLAVPRADGRSLYWVYPGTELVFTFSGEWPEEDQTPEVVVGVKRVGQYKGRASYQFGWSKPKWIRGATPVIRSGDVAEKGPFRVAINSPDDGPLVVIDTLFVGTPETAFVVTAEGLPTLLGGE